MPSHKEKGGSKTTPEGWSTNAKQDASAERVLDNDQQFAELVSLTRLRNTWGEVRKEAKQHRVRDAVDCLDWAVSIDATLVQIRENLLSGEYTPSPPTRYELAKSRGAYRIMTVPNIRDAVVYRLICDEALAVATPSKVPGAFFSRRHKTTPVGKTFDLEDDPYLRFFDVWLRYQEYRTRTMLNEPYEILVVTDITNYFDSISHELLMEYLSPLGLPRKTIGLLGRILETFKPPAGHSPNPKIGIPVDEFDCSRELAHVFLFEHDKRMVNLVGESNFVRWMDDQNVGAKSKTEARKIVHQLTASLSSQRLTLNSGKTQFLTPEEVIVHFQLDANEELNEWEQKYKGKLSRKAMQAKMDLMNIWSTITNGSSNGKGHWDKILKRVYGFAAKVDSPILDDRMYDDLIEHPHLDERIFLCLARRNKGEELLALFKKYCEDGESLFEATEAAFFEACLLLDATPKTEAAIRDLANGFARGAVEGQSGGTFGKASALLCLYWFDVSGHGLADLFPAEQAPLLPAVLARAWLATVTARDSRLLHESQAKLVGHPSDDVARLSRFLTEVLSGTVDQVGNYKHQRSRWPATGKFYDSRAWLQFEILSRASSSKLKATARTDLAHFAKLTRTRQEKRILSRIRTRLN